ncbi:hypothetical protein Y032_0017g3474 [Ancylostoma ceylanicum]|nr:hypothetical protein Y032_0017g3474 [Ancylostoma ceylanicum]
MMWAATVGYKVGTTRRGFIYSRQAHDFASAVSIRGFCMFSLQISQFLSISHVSPKFSFCTAYRDSWTLVCPNSTK